MFVVIFAVRLIRAIVGLYVVTIAGDIPLLLMFAPSLPVTSPFLFVASLFVPLGFCVAAFLGLGALGARHFATVTSAGAGRSLRTDQASGALQQMCDVAARPAKL